MVQPEFRRIRGMDAARQKLQKCSGPVRWPGDHVHRSRQIQKSGDLNLISKCLENLKVFKTQVPKN
jgi:hypothetical protein